MSSSVFCFTILPFIQLFFQCYPKGIVRSPSTTCPIPCERSMRHNYNYDIDLISISFIGASLLSVLHGIRYDTCLNSKFTIVQKQPLTLNHDQGEFSHDAFLLLESLSKVCMCLYVRLVIQFSAF